MLWRHAILTVENNPQRLTQIFLGINRLHLTALLQQNALRAL